MGTERYFGCDCWVAVFNPHKKEIAKQNGVNLYYDTDLGKLRLLK